MLIRLGTRQSPLALWQANHIGALLQAKGYQVELVKIITSGDVSTAPLGQAGPLGQSGGQGLFTKEIQRALHENRCDLAVHSLKDLPTDVSPGLRLTAVPPREETADCLISRFGTLDGLPIGARVGTGSPRRRAQLLAARPDLDVLEIRGNLDTRLRKLDEAQYDAILLAYAGLHRLGLAGRITQKLTDELMLPAVGQAALGLETRDQDIETIRAASQLDHPQTHSAVLAERSLLRSMRAGCLAPLAALARTYPDSIELTSRVFSADGRQVIASRQVMMLSENITEIELYAQAVQLGVNTAKDLISQGADGLIQSTRNTPFHKT
ncbi:MAG: hydroxymethylbilane synthase [Pirellula sp.]